MKKTLSFLMLLLILSTCVFASHRVTLTFDPFTFQSFVQKNGETKDTTLYAKWAETKLVSEILNTVSGGFPKTATPGITPPSGAWKNQHSVMCWIYSPSASYSAIYFSNGSNYKMFSIGDSKAEKDGDTYKWNPAGTNDTITFKMTGEELTSIEISGSEGVCYGTYAPAVE